MASFVWKPPSGLTLTLHVEAAVVLHTEDWSEENINTLMASFPTAEGWSHSSAQQIGPLFMHTPQGKGVRVRWPGQAEMDGPIQRLDDIAPEYRFQGERWLQPSIGEQVDRVAPIMRWWALLFGLSTLARYEPAKWTHELRLDSSPLAVRIEDALDEALNAIPHLVLEALFAKPILLPRHAPPGS